jgi:hypothetical protein
MRHEKRRMTRDDTSIGYTYRARLGAIIYFGVTKCHPFFRIVLKAMK